MIHKAGGAEYGVLVQLQESISNWPALVPAGDLAGKPSIPLGLAVILIGSRQSANIRISSSRVSRAHALVVSSDRRVLIRDLASRTGTTVNGQRIREAQLQPGDLVGIGPFLFEFSPGLAMPPLAERQSLQTAQLEILGGEVLHTDQRITLIGKRNDSDIWIPDEEVSTAHAALFDMDGRRYVRDLGSRLGTWVNGKMVTGLEIRLGDEIRIGSAVMRYLPADAGSGSGAPIVAPAAPPRINGMGGRIAGPENGAGRVAAELLTEDAPAKPNGNGRGHNGRAADGHAGGQAVRADVDDDDNQEDEGADLGLTADVEMAVVHPAEEQAPEGDVLELIDPEAAIETVGGGESTATGSATSALPSELLQALAVAVAAPAAAEETVAPEPAAIGAAATGAGLVLEPAAVAGEVVAQPVAAPVEQVEVVASTETVTLAEASGEAEPTQMDWAMLSEVLARAVGTEPVVEAEAAPALEISDPVAAPPANPPATPPVAPLAAPPTASHAVPPAAPAAVHGAGADVEADGTPVTAAEVVREFRTPGDWAEWSPLLQANLMVLPVPMSVGPTLTPMLEAPVQWPTVMVGAMSPMLSGWDPGQENHTHAPAAASAEDAKGVTAAVEAPAPVSEPVAAPVVEDPVAEAADVTPEIGEIEVIWTSAPSMTASMTVDLVWDEPGEMSAVAASVTPRVMQAAMEAARPPVTPEVRSVPVDVGAGSATGDSEMDVAAALHGETVVEETAPEAPAAKPGAPEPQTVGWTIQGNPEGWGPLAAAVTVAPIIGMAPPAETPAGLQSIPRRPLLQADGTTRPAPRSGSSRYAFDAPRDLTWLWAILGVLGVVGFAALMWYVVIPVLLPKGHPIGGDGEDIAPAPIKRVDRSRSAGAPDAGGNSAAATQPSRTPLRTPTRNPGHPASRRSGWLE